MQMLVPCDNNFLRCEVTQRDTYKVDKYSFLSQQLEQLLTQLIMEYAPCLIFVEKSSFSEERRRLGRIWPRDTTFPPTAVSEPSMTTTRETSTQTTSESSLRATDIILQRMRSLPSCADWTTMLTAKSPTRNSLRPLRLKNFLMWALKKDLSRAKANSNSSPTASLDTVSMASKAQELVPDQWWALTTRANSLL